MTLGGLLLLAGLLPAAPVPEDGARKELHKLQGGWKLVSAESNGKATPADKVAALGMTIKGETLTVQEGSEVVEEASFRLDRTANPPAIDLKVTAGTDKGKTVLGIYRLEDERLTICVAEPGRERPSKFAAPEGTRHTLFVFKRAKP
jgi:uncharacterized protein (TIGR03067 family)